MKKSMNGLAVLIGLSLSLPVLADLKPFYTDEGVCSFKNSLGEVVVPAKNYLSCGEFSEGLTHIGVVRDHFDGTYNHYQGFIDRSGNTVIPTDHIVSESGAYGETDFRDFHNGLVAVFKSKPNAEGIYGYMNKQRELIVPYEYDSADDFKDGLAVVSKNRGLNDNPRSGVIDRTGRLVIPLKYESLWGYAEGMFIYGEKSHWGDDLIYGFLDKKGDVKVKAKWNDILPFSEGLATVNIGDWGFVDKSGNYAITPKYSDAYSFSEGLAFVRVGNEDDGKWGVINKQGNYIIAPQYDFIDPFSFSECCDSGTDDFAGAYKNGNAYVYDFMNKKKGKYGPIVRHTIDSKGNVIGKKLFADWNALYDHIWQTHNDNNS
ncbi:WG repeat-containing protein [Psychrobacter sp. 16-MNA-CIBAN-0192]|uniref:WG repeat-containing protein n=1 Tax=Psychrobacter sp. 16-MNA-CIBAN-0192 TaxID=3140448 RepID=UPI0033223E61